MNNSFDLSIEKQEQIARGERIKNIRENELRLNKTDLAKLIGVSSQFLGLVESGRGNLSYKSIKLLRDLSNHSADYILFGLDDNSITKMKEYLEFYSESEIINSFKVVQDVVYLLKNKK